MTWPHEAKRDVLEVGCSVSSSIGWWIRHAAARGYDGLLRFCEWMVDEGLLICFVCGILIVAVVFLVIATGGLVGSLQASATRTEIDQACRAAGFDGLDYIGSAAVCVRIEDGQVYRIPASDIWEGK